MPSSKGRATRQLARIHALTTSKNATTCITQNSCQAPKPLYQYQKGHLQFISVIWLAILTQDLQTLYQTGNYRGSLLSNDQENHYIYLIFDKFSVLFLRTLYSRQYSRLSEDNPLEFLGEKELSFALLQIFKMWPEKLTLLPHRTNFCLNNKAFVKHFYA